MMEGERKMSDFVTDFEWADWSLFGREAMASPRNGRRGRVAEVMALPN
jgi:hypothetical protein